MSLSKKGLLSLPFKIYCCWKLENVSNLFYLLALMLQECNQTFPPITQERHHAIFWPSCSILVDPGWSCKLGWSWLISILVDPGWSCKLGWSWLISIPVDLLHKFKNCKNIRFHRSTNILIIIFSKKIPPARLKESPLFCNMTKDFIKHRTCFTVDTHKYQMDTHKIPNTNT